MNEQFNIPKEKPMEKKKKNTPNISYFQYKK